MDWERSTQSTVSSVSKMADGDSSTEWELFFNSLLRILDDCESLPPTSLEREMLGMRLEQAVYALQQVVSLAVDQSDSESEAFSWDACWDDIPVSSQTLSTLSVSSSGDSRVYSGTFKRT